MPRPEFVVEHTPEEPPAPQLEVTPRTGDIETFDGTLDFDAVAHDAAKADGLEVQEEVALKPQQLEVEGLAATQYESAPCAARADTTPEPEPDRPTVDLPLIMPEDVTPPRPPAVASPSSPPPRPALPEWPTPLAPPQPPAAVLPAAVVLSDDDGAADTAALSRAEPVLTETMADLYLKQGHSEEALRVYQALLAQRPDDARLHARVAALSPGELGRGGGGGGVGGPPRCFGAPPGPGGRGGGFFVGAALSRPGPRGPPRPGRPRRGERPPAPRRTRFPGIGFAARGGWGRPRR